MKTTRINGGIWSIKNTDIELATELFGPGGLPLARYRAELAKKREIFAHGRSVVFSQQRRCYLFCPEKEWLTKKAISVIILV